MFEQNKTDFCFFISKFVQTKKVKHVSHPQ